MAYIRTAPKLELRHGGKKTPVILGHRKFCHDGMMALELPLTLTDKIDKDYVWIRPYTLDKDSFKSGLPFDGKADYEAYTDGSGLEDEQFGSGWVVYQKQTHLNVRVEERSQYLGNDASVFQGELYAIKKVADWVFQNCKNQTIILHSDSRAALQAINAFRVKSALVQETKDSLRSACGRNTITLRWIKAHSGHLGNEKADNLAKEGAQGSPTVIPVELRMPYTNVKRNVKQAFREKWQQQWASRPDCRQTKMWIPTLNKRWAHDILYSPRRLVGLFVQVITGHNFLKRHEALVTDTEDNECRLCLEDEETTFHVFAECPALAEQRKLVCGHIVCTDFRDRSIKGIASFINEASIGSLLGTLEE